MPKFLVNGDGSLGKRNDVRCAGIEQQSSAFTARRPASWSMATKAALTGYLVGEENKGLACMFTMMNDASCDRAAGRRHRRGGLPAGAALRARPQQGARPTRRALVPSAIIHHPDVSACLMTMKAMTQSARAVCYVTAGAIDRSQRARTPAERKAAADRAGFTDADRQGLFERHWLRGRFAGRPGAWRHGLRRRRRRRTIHARLTHRADLRGHNGIQAIDLVTRKLPVDGGGVEGREIADMRRRRRPRATNDPAFGATATRLAERWRPSNARPNIMLEKPGLPQDALRGRNARMRLFGLVRGAAPSAQLAYRSPANGRRRHPIPPLTPPVSRLRGSLPKNVVVTAGGPRRRLPAQPNPS